MFRGGAPLTCHTDSASPCMVLTQTVEALLGTRQNAPPVVSYTDSGSTRAVLEKRKPGRSLEKGPQVQHGMPGPTGNRKRDIEHLERAIAEGDISATAVLALLLKNQEPRRAKDLLELGHSKGNKPCSFMLALFVQGDDPDRAASPYGCAMPKGERANFLMMVAFAHGLQTTYPSEADFVLNGMGMK